ncbi:MAG: hypothetical protein H0U18_04040 [Pyrinomonadaceae bacterium]|nr:hypothetical protein [Pyrinomonadaceae bacterium]
MQFQHRLMTSYGATLPRYRWRFCSGVASADRRKLFLAAFRYGRTLVANDSVALQYTVDSIPVALATGNIVFITTVGPVTTFQRETTYSGGLTSLGLQPDFANGSRVHPFVHVNGGGLIFSKSVPLPGRGPVCFCQ